MRMIQTASEINDYMPEHVVERCINILNDHKKAMNGAKILIVGMAYKEDIDDARESPMVEVVEQLQKYQVEVSYYDPFISEVEINKETFKSIEDLNALSHYDMILVGTAHTNVAYEKLQESGLPIFDTKNAMKHIYNREGIYLL